MPRKPTSPVPVDTALARRIWLRAQRLDEAEPFGGGAAATTAAIEHLGYVQIDTINVIERCHHHILWSRIPGYRREHLAHAQADGRTVFEAWTHALSYVPVRDYRFFLPRMLAHRAAPHPWFASVDPKDLGRMIARIRRDGAMTIRDVDGDVLVEKDHPWASRKPSKRVLELAFFNGELTVARRDGMVKAYELPARHFGWSRRPRPATEAQVTEYMLDRALRAQGIVSLDSVCHLEPSRKPALAEIVEARVRRRRLVPVALEGAERVAHYAEPAALDAPPAPFEPRVHLLSPFDPLVIQRRRLAAFFGYEHLFEAYVPAEKRVLGYFALPVLVGDEVVAALDIKADRRAGRLDVRRWTWVGTGEAAGRKAAIEEELHRFAAFQFPAPETGRDGGVGGAAA